MISHHRLGVQTPQRNKGFQIDTSLMSRGMRIRIVSAVLAKTTSVRLFDILIVRLREPGGGVHIFTTLPYFDHHTQHPPPSTPRPSQPQPALTTTTTPLLPCPRPPPSPVTTHHPPHPRSYNRRLLKCLLFSRVHPQPPIMALRLNPNLENAMHLRRRLLYDLRCGGCVVMRSCTFLTSPTCLRALILLRLGERDSRWARREEIPAPSRPVGERGSGVAQRRELSLWSGSQGGMNGRARDDTPRTISGVHHSLLPPRADVVDPGMVRCGIDSPRGDSVTKDAREMIKGGIGWVHHSLLPPRADVVHPRLMSPLIVSSATLSLAGRHGAGV
jgi:hypothetical protein